MIWRIQMRRLAAGLWILAAMSGCAGGVSHGVYPVTSEQQRFVRAHARYVDVQRRDPPAGCDFLRGAQLREEDYPRALRRLRHTAVEQHANYVAVDAILADDGPGAFRILTRLFTCPT